MKLSRGVKTRAFTLVEMLLVLTINISIALMISPKVIDLNNMYKTNRFIDIVCNEYNLQHALIRHSNGQLLIYLIPSSKSVIFKNINSNEVKEIYWPDNLHLASGPQVIRISGNKGTKPTSFSFIDKNHKIIFNIQMMWGKLTCKNVDLK